MRQINTIYLKEFNNVDEVFRKGTKLASFAKKAILLFKKIFCVVTIKEDGVCILPYQNLESFFKIKMFFLKKILLKLNLPIVLSDYLDNKKEFEKEMLDSSFKIIEGRRLSNYLIPEIVGYICKMTKEEKKRQEISLLVQEQTADIAKMITQLAGEVRRIQIVTMKIGQFKRLENELEDKFGVSCQITNNRRKSLLKSKIIINFDYSTELLNQFTINPNAIVIDINQKTQIDTKAFCGIHVYDYQLNYDNVEIKDKSFETKKIYEAKLIGKNYEQIRKSIKEENARIVNLIGKKGIIHNEEYVRLAKNSCKILDKSI